MLNSAVTRPGSMPEAFLGPFCERVSELVRARGTVCLRLVLQTALQNQPVDFGMKK